MSVSLAPVTLLIAIGVLLWDIVLAGWIASRKEAPILFTQLTSLCGLLVAPALVVALASGTEDGARTISGVSWLLPVIAVAFVLQVFYAIAARLVSTVVGVPILLYDIKSRGCEAYLSLAREVLKRDRARALKRGGARVA